MNDSSNYNLDPSDYLASMTPGGTNYPHNTPKSRFRAKLLPIGVVAAVLVAIAVLVFGILGVTRGANNGTTSESSQNEANEPDFEVVNNTEALPDLGQFYQPLGSKSDGILVAKRISDGAIVFLDDNYDVVSKMDSDKYELYSNEFHDGRLAVICKTLPIWTKIGFLNKNAELVIDCNYTYASDFKNGTADVMINSPIIDENGERPKTPTSIRGIIDTDGKMLESVEKELEFAPEVSL